MLARLDRSYDFELNDIRTGAGDAVGGATHGKKSSAR
jgi:hypothetical protein